MRVICVCRATDKELREKAKADGLPLRWLREVKRMHRKFRFFHSDDPAEWEATECPLG